MANTLSPEELANKVTSEATEATTKEVKLNKSKISTVVVTSSDPVVHQDILTMRSYIKSFLDGYKISAKERATRFKDLLYYAYNNKTNRVLDELLAFFKKYRKTILSPEKALQGSYFLTTGQQEKVHMLYLLFYRISSPVQIGKVDLKYMASIIGNNNVLTYITNKIKQN